MPQEEAAAKLALRWNLTEEMVRRLPAQGIGPHE